jgi:hypothetical protein
MNAKSMGLRKAFSCGSSTSCSQHIRQHYGIYQKWCCLEQGLIENYQAIPPQILREREAAKMPKKQTKLDDMVIKEKRLAEFSREGILEAVAKLIACNDQVSQILILHEDVAKGVVIVAGCCRQESF